MAERIPEQPSPTTLPVLAGLGGFDPAPEHLSTLWPAVRTFHAAASRLRELDLSQVEPAVVYRPAGGEV